MSKFGYLEQGELNSSYLYGLLNEYLDNIIEMNSVADTNIENKYKVDVGASNFKRGFSDWKNRLHISKKSIDEYNKLVSSNYAKLVKNRLKIYMTSNILENKDLFEIIQISKAIGFDRVIPEVEANRNKAIGKCNKEVLKIVNDSKFLKDAISERVLFDSQVEEIKPFLSEQVSPHIIHIKTLNDVVVKLVEYRTNELAQLNFEEYYPKFDNNLEDFYHIQITSDGVGEDVEDFIRGKMLQKLAISKQEELAVEDRLAQVASVDNLLKKLGLTKVEKLMQKLIKLRCMEAQAKEGIDSCKGLLNSSNIENKKNIFLTMDAILYKLSNQCKKLTEKVKLKLQLIDKEKLFEQIKQVGEEVNRRPQNKAVSQEEEVHITEEEGGSADDNDDEFIIDEE